MEKRDHPHKGLSLSRRSSGGKGDRLRAVDGDKYREGYAAIDWDDTEDELEGDDDEE